MPRLRNTFTIQGHTIKAGSIIKYNHQATGAISVELQVLNISQDRIEFRALTTPGPNRSGQLHWFIGTFQQLTIDSVTDA